MCGSSMRLDRSIASGSDNGIRASALSRRGFLRLTGVSLLSFVGVSSLVTLSGCANASSNQLPSTTDSGDSSKSVAMVLTGPANDGGWGATCYQAMTTAASELGWTSQYSENVAQADWVTAMQNYCDQGFTLILLPGQEFGDVAKQVARDNPDVKFAVMSGSVRGDNIESITPDNTQVGKVAGALAAVLTKTKAVGYIGGMEIDSTKAQQQAYEETVKKLSPDVAVSSVFVGSFTDIAKGKDAGKTLFESKSVDFLFGDGDPEENGTIEALKEASASDGIRRAVMGNPADLGGADDDTYACSVVIDYPLMVKNVLQEVEDGIFGNKTYTGTLANGSFKVGTISNKLVSADEAAKFKEYVEKINNGEL